MKFSARQIAEFLHGELVGNPSVEVNNLSKIEEGTPGTLSFLANPKYTHYIYQTHASIVLVHKDFEPEHPIEATLIKVDDPYACLAMLLNLVNEATIAKRGIEQPNYVSSSVTLPDDIYLGAFAYIGERVKIGKNVKIYPQTYIGNDVVIGDNVTIFAGVKIYHSCVIGNNCILHAGTVIGADGFGFAPQANGEYAKIAQIGNVVLEDNVEIGANTTIDRATMGSTIIKKGVKLDNLIQIAHNVEVGEHTVIAAQAGIAYDRRSSRSRRAYQTGRPNSSRSPIGYTQSCRERRCNHGIPCCSFQRICQTSRLCKTASRTYPYGESSRKGDRSIKRTIEK